MAGLGIVDRFRERVPNDLLAALVVCIRQGTREAGNRLREAVELGRYSRPEARDVFPHERRAHVEARLHTLTEDFVGLSVEFHFNKVGNCHRLVRLPGVLLTVCAVTNPNRMARPTRQRKIYASETTGNTDFRQSFFTVNDYNQLAIGSHDLSALEKEYIYGVVIYSPAEDNPLGVGYVGVGFPDAKYRWYIERLNLTGLFQRVVAPTTVERIEDLANVEMLLGETNMDAVPDLFLDKGM